MAEMLPGQQQRGPMMSNDHQDEIKETVRPI